MTFIEYTNKWNGKIQNIVQNIVLCRTWNMGVE